MLHKFHDDFDDLSNLNLHLPSIYRLRGARADSWFSIQEISGKTTFTKKFFDKIKISLFSAVPGKTT